MRVRGWIVALMCATVAGVGADTAWAGPRDVPVPKVEGPLAVTADSHPFLATEKDLARQGYVEKEFFFSGTGRHYTDGEVASEHAYKTRMVVRRPVSPKRFNGVVILEWINVTGQFDLEIDWFHSNEHFLREGYAWVGVSAQRVGVDALKTYNRDRYG